MNFNPPLSLAPRFPFTVLVALAAIGLSARWWFAHSLAGCVAPADNVLQAPWVLLTSALPHGSVIHLFFNLYWWWYFAARVELGWGATRLAAISALFAVVSSAAEHTLFRTGIGLSGVVYGLCTFLWHAQHLHPALAGCVSRKTLELFAVWFVVCIVLTVANIMPIANAAHGFGALGGWLLGSALRYPAKRGMWSAMLIVVLGVTLLGATVARPWVNLSRFSSSNARAGYSALARGDYAAAVELLEKARDESPGNPSTLTNLAIAYMRSGRPAAAIAPLRRAVELEPSRREELAPSISSLLDHQAAISAARQRWDLAREQANESLRWTPTDSYAARLIQWLDAQKKLSLWERAFPQSTIEEAPPEDTHASPHQ